MTPSRPSARAVLTTAAATAAHYALPDVVRSRTARGWVKVAITGLAGAAAVPELRSAWAEARDSLASAGPDDPRTAAGPGPVPTRTLAVATAAGIAALALSARGVVAAERWAFRHGQARAAAGRRLPHTGPALVYGVVAGALWFVTAPATPDSTG
jgi:hypothetical protein